jgi:hypothetical protein
VALIESGSVGDFSVAPLRPSVQRLSREYGVNTARVFRYVSDQFSADDYGFAVSREPRGIALGTLKLEKQAQQFFKRLFRHTSKVYFLAWGWDLSGAPVFVYPGIMAGPGDVLIPMRVGDVREFLGVGIPLFPTRRVTSGIQVRIQIWDSRKGVRDFGAAMSEVARAIDESELSSILRVVAPIAGVAAGLGSAVSIINEAEKAALALVKVISPILVHHGDQVLDLFEGNYPASDPWRKGLESHSGHGTTIQLSRLRQAPDRRRSAGSSGGLPAAP